jgi:hypothetical protein
MEVAARLAKERALAEHPEFNSEDVGVCFISPCPAKASYVKNGFGDYQSAVDCVISISDIYFALLHVMKSENVPKMSCSSGALGVGWASSGGESTAIFNDKYLATDGIENVVNVLEQILAGEEPDMETAVPATVVTPETYKDVMGKDAE